MENPQLIIFLLLVTLWVLPWKGFALWKAARNSSKIWFIVLLVVNTMAIMEILYIFVFSKNKQASSRIQTSSDDKAGIDK